MLKTGGRLTPEARQYILFINAIAPVGMIVVLWGIYVAAALFDFDLPRLLKRWNRDLPQPAGTTTLYLWIAIVGTVIAAGFAWVSIRRALSLAEHGISVVCEVLQVRKISVHGMVRVDYQYVVDGRAYRRSLSCPRTTAMEYDRGTELLEIVYDPQNPKRVMLKSDVFQKATSVSERPPD